MRHPPGWQSLAAIDDRSFDLVIVGSGFAGSFFLQEWLRAAAPGERVLVLERGPFISHQQQVRERRGSPVEAAATYVRAGPDRKSWVFNIGFGGGSNCWTGNVPRLLPEDFRLASTYGVGRDWPLSYAELAPYYDEVEATMAVAGPADGSPFPDVRWYPQPPHRFSDADAALKRAFPDLFFATPTARAKLPTEGRSPCCANGVCSICPVDAKFTIQNELLHLYADERVTLVTDAEVVAIETANRTATGVVVRTGGAEHRIAASFVALAANALFNPHILLRSGLDHPLLGRRLNEQRGIMADVHLSGLNGYNGGSYVTGLSYHFYAGAHRRERAACLVEHVNVAPVRARAGKWFDAIRLFLIFEDLPEERNRVAPAEDGDPRPAVHYHGPGDYLQRGIAAVQADIGRLLAPLPVEEVIFHPDLRETESHIIGTVVMGNEPAESVIDRHLVHHHVRNLAVLGSSSFPTCSPSNPTLTLSALSLWSARHLRRSAKEG